MSKLLTDSENLMTMLFDGVDPDDTPLACTIKELKKCACDCMEMRITGYTLSKEEKDKLDGFNAVFVETWRMLADLQNDFIDLIEASFKPKKGGEK